MFKRIRNLWNLSEYKPTITNVVDSLDGRQQITLEKDSPKVKAEFFGEGTEKEFKDLEKEDKGFKGIFGL